eukprot:2886562-Prymnesium_polylepis.1
MAKSRGVSPRRPITMQSPAESSAKGARGGSGGEEGGSAGDSGDGGDIGGHDDESERGWRWRRVGWWWQRGVEAYLPACCGADIAV